MSQSSSGENAQWLRAQFSSSTRDGCFTCISNSSSRELQHLWAQWTPTDRHTNTYILKIIIFKNESKLYLFVSYIQGTLPWHPEPEIHCQIPPALQPTALQDFSSWTVLHGPIPRASCHLLWESNLVLSTKKALITLECKLARTGLVQIPGASVTKVRLLFYQFNNVWLANWSSHIFPMQCNIFHSWILQAMYG